MKDPVPVDPPKKKRTPTEVQRDRLTERIEKLQTECEVAVVKALDEISERAEQELVDRRNRARKRINARFEARLGPLQRMLSALTPAAPGKGD